MGLSSLQLGLTGDPFLCALNRHGKDGDAVPEFFLAQEEKSQPEIPFVPHLIIGKLSNKLPHDLHRLVRPPQVPISFLHSQVSSLHDEMLRMTPNHPIKLF